MGKILTCFMLFLGFSLSGCWMDQGAVVRVEGRLGPGLDPPSDDSGTRGIEDTNYMIAVIAKINGVEQHELIHPRFNGSVFDEQVTFSERIYPWSFRGISIKNVRFSAFQCKLFCNTPLSLTILKSDLDRHGGTIEIELNRITPP